MQENNEEQPKTLNLDVVGKVTVEKIDISITACIEFG
jgi:hypothetical protein